MTSHTYSTDKFQFSEHCLDMIFSNVLENGFEFNSDLDGWTLLKYLLSYVRDINTPLQCGTYRGLNRLLTAVRSRNKKMVLLLLSNQHGSQLEGENVPILIDEMSRKWIDENLDH